MSNDEVRVELGRIYHVEVDLYLNEELRLYPDGYLRIAAIPGHERVMFGGRVSAREVQHLGEGHPHRHPELDP